jgi:D-alanyl-D-alanine carboxypeptidase
MSRPHLARFLLTQLLVALAGLYFFSSASPAFAKVESSIVVDETGKVIEERNADLPNYPASLTKMMTLYLAFEGLEQGRLRLDQRFPVSHYAAMQAPSKLGLVAGDAITLHDLILGMVTKSANDAAVVVAEGIAGNEHAFAERMNQKARALGMTRTNFRNASGLPNPAQSTTARDLAKLAIALYRDFPKEYAYFATDEFTYNGVTHANHNHLMDAFEGMDGIKTGYIRAAGFNLAASAVRDNRRLFGIVMGGQSAHTRDMKMAQLLTDGFAGRTQAPDIMTADASSDDDADTPPDNTLSRRAARTLAALSPVGRAEAATAARAGVLRHGRHETGERWSIQVGAYAQESGAQKALSLAVAKLPGAHSKATQVLAPGETDKERFFRARISNFSRLEAERACRTLHKRHLQCAVVAPGARAQLAAAPARHAG